MHQQCPMHARKQHRKAYTPGLVTPSRRVPMAIQFRLLPTIEHAITMLNNRAMRWCHRIDLVRPGRRSIATLLAAPTASCQSQTRETWLARATSARWISAASLSARAFRARTTSSLCRTPPRSSATTTGAPPASAAKKASPGD